MNIHTINFDPIERRVEISYSEERDQSPLVMMVRTISVAPAEVEMEYAELCDAATSLVDAALLVMRAPTP